MTIKASISSGYKWRLGILAVACLGFSAWFIYDGSVKYPRFQHIHETYLQIQQEHPVDYAQCWVERARQEGWPTSPPKPYTDMDIITQYVLAALVLPIGLLFLWAYVAAGMRWVSADEAGLHASFAPDAPWDSIESINKDRWKTKGIAVVHYQRDGKPHKITLDDWKFDREPTVAIVAQVDEHLGLTPSAEVETALAPAEREAEELAS